MEALAGRRPEAHAARWERLLDHVASTDELIAVARDYLASLAPQYLARLPEDCRPGTIKYDDDIDFWAYRLAQRYCAENDAPVDGDLLHELLDFFLHALIRLAELRRNLPGPLRIQPQ